MTIAERSGGRLPVQIGVPTRAGGLQLIGDMKGSGYRRPPALVRRADGQTISLTPLLYHVLRAVDGERDVEAIAAETSRTFGRRIDGPGVAHLIEAKLRPLGLLLEPDGSEPRTRPANPLLALRFRYVVSDPDRTRRITAPFAWLFHPLIVVLAVVGFVAVSGWVLFERGLGFAAAQAFHNPALLLAVFLVSVLSAGFHEFGHAAGARYGGATPGAMGAGLYLLWPAFYTDVTDSYRLGRGGRLRADLGGLYFNAILALACFGLYWLSGWAALLLVIATQLLQMIRQLPPLLRFDGYHILADLTGVPDLYLRIRPTLASLLPGNRQLDDPHALRWWARAVVTAWVAAVVPFMVGSVLLTVISFPRLVASTGHSLGRQWALMEAFLGRGHIAAGLVHVLGLVAVGLPAAGVTYLLVRMGSRLVRTALRSTAGRPAARTAVVALLVAGAGGLAFAWWPHGDYRPIQPYERGTVQDAMPAAFYGPGLHAGGRSAVTTAWPDTAGSVPPASSPVLALVLVPRAGAAAAGPAPTWVFPFNRPAPPGPGGNQALAVNTTDGSTEYQVAFALVWASGNSPVLNRNEAYAFASCQHCRTTAVAYQVVLIVGQARVAAPQDIAGALNYDCIDCLTQALASQLVLTLPGTPPASEVQAIDAIWAEVQTFGAHLQGLSYSAIESALSGFDRQIRAVVARYSPPPNPTGAPPSTALAVPSGPTTTTSAATGPATTVAAGATSPTSVPVATTTPAAAPATTTTAPATTTTAPSPSTTVAGSP